MFSHEWIRFRGHLKNTTESMTAMSIMVTTVHQTPPNIENDLRVIEPLAQYE